MNRLTRLIPLRLEHQIACPWELRQESPLRLGESDEPEPDLPLVRHRADGYLDSHSTAADTILVSEAQWALLEALRAEVEALLATIPPATPA